MAFYADAVSVFCEKATGNGGGEPWHIDAVGAHEAWRKTCGSKDVRVAVVDSYFDLSHPAFKGMRLESALSLEDGTVTIRHRDTMQQERVAIAELPRIVHDMVSLRPLFAKLVK